MLTITCMCEQCYRSSEKQMTSDWQDLDILNLDLLKYSNSTVTEGMFSFPPYPILPPSGATAPLQHSPTPQPLRESGVGNVTPSTNHYQI